MPFPSVDKDAAGLVKPTRQRYVPMTADVCHELLELVRDELRPRPGAVDRLTHVSHSSSGPWLATLGGVHDIPLVRLLSMAVTVAPR